MILVRVFRSLSMATRGRVFHLDAGAAQLAPALRRNELARFALSPRNNAVISRCSARGTIEPGSNSPTVTPSTKAE